MKDSKNNIVWNVIVVIFCITIISLCGQSIHSINETFYVDNAVDIWILWTIIIGTSIMLLWNGGRIFYKIANSVNTKNIK